MMTVQLSRHAPCILFAVVVSVPGLTRAAPSVPTEPFTGVSGALADNGEAQADRGRRYEADGRYADALKEYREAIEGLDRNFDKPSNHASGNPQVFLVRGGAAVDAARAMSRMPGHDPGAVRNLAARAESDFSTVIKSTRPVDAASRDLLLKATLGRGYARLLRGGLEEARTDLRGLKFGQNAEMGGAQQVQGALVRIDSGIAAQAKAPPERGSTPKMDKLTALMNLGQEIVKNFFPRYQGLAVAIGDVASAFK